MTSSTRRFVRSLRRLLSAIPQEERAVFETRLEKLRDQFSTEPNEPATAPTKTTKTTKTARRRTRRRGQ